MKKRGLFAPGYYKEFKCISSDCRHSCCIGWEIDVDDATLKKYALLPSDTGERIRSTISEDEPRHFKLCEGRCPHLDERGLCKIICELGEDFLCDICRLHPRFFNETARGLEVGLGAGCEECARIILSSDLYSDIIEVGEEECEEIEFDIFMLRSEIYSILRDRESDYKHRLERICEHLKISPTLISDGEWREVLSSLEYLDSEHRELFDAYTSEFMQTKLCIYLERALAYFIYRHASGAQSYEEFRTGVCFSLFCERLLASISERASAKNEEEIGELLRIISEEIEYSIDNTDIIRSEIEFAI